MLKLLPKLAKVLEHPNIVIAADNDAEGLSAAEANKPWSTPNADGLDWWDIWHRNGPAETAAMLSAKLKTASSPLDGFSLSTAKELSQREFKEIVWLKDKLLPANLALIAGHPSVVKAGTRWDLRATLSLTVTEFCTLRTRIANAAKRPLLKN